MVNSVANNMDKGVENNLEKNVENNHETQVILSIKNLKKHFPIRGGVLLRQVGNVYAVDGVSFDVHKGETVGLVGESGCGKSTVGKTILRLLEPTSGEVKFAGENLCDLDKKQMRSLRKEMQIIFQDPYESLNSRHNVGAILEEPFIIHKLGTAKERRQWVIALLQKVGLPETSIDRYPHEFSGGQRQRIGIARAIALKPKLIVCDEPVSALDVSVQSQIINLLLGLQQEMDLSLLFIAHDLAVVKHVSDRIAVMYLGKIVELASAEDIYANHKHPYTEALISAIPVPDPENRKKKQVLIGEVPSPANPPSGCYFHTRCPYMQDICQKETPLLTGVTDSCQEHVVACHFPLNK